MSKQESGERGTQVITADELSIANEITQTAVVNLLIEKGIFSREELLSEVERVNTAALSGNE